MSQRSGQRGASKSLARATRSSPRRGKLLELAHRLEDLGRRVEGFIDEQLEHLQQAGALLQTRPQPTASTSPEDLQRHRETWEREQRDEIRKIEEDRRVLAEAWVRLESEQRQLLSQRDAARRSGDEIEADVPEPISASEPARSRSKKGKKSSEENRENGRPAMDASTRQAMMRQFQQLRSDVRKHAQRRQQC